eukprot:CAMPEP_0184664380 /NCGR_PEP_ID=MMETSP0308-20130426/52500_1 /TAXON_ID=38269 /ORGANISM="Gloeochaete witrockiana, Strain SAG 46.84" /LENGTH=240 /DNA_ID=CAMNT_0027107737 /DNA_START=132 /DNA_END=851 /DNA_ORIENTATION=+
MNSAAAGKPQESCGCPAEPVGSKYKNPLVYNVYGEVIDPRNQMPASYAAQQKPLPGQRLPLPTSRIQSSIRKGGTESTWLYPSEQQFWNSLNRKSKADGIHEKDISMVVAIHNGMNERTWLEVLEWEKRHHSDCNDPTLLRFRGRPDQLSPKALFRKWISGDVPFDRHDWIVDRCGKEVRYIIDYYHDEGSPLSDDQAVSVNDKGFLMTRRIWIDVRPALDSWDSAYDRVHYGLRRVFSW